MRTTYFNEKDVILSVNDYNYLSDNISETFNISYGIDKNFLYGCGISIASILVANQGTSLTFHVFTDFLTEDVRNKFSKLAQKYCARIVIYLVNCDALKSLPSTRNWTYATYFRFIIADYFAGKAKKVLYLDADIGCKGSIKELIDLQFTENEIAAVVMEGNTAWWGKRAETLHTPGLAEGYFNAGFLLINIAAWNAEEISKKAIEMLRDPEVTSKITHLDQDVLNMLLVGKARFIDPKFNTQYSLNYELKKSVVRPVNDKTVFIHYIGPTKPWHLWGDYPVSACFLNAKDHSPWKDDALLAPKTAAQYRYCAKHQLHQKQFVKGILSYVLYFKKKITK
ncbi:MULTISPECIES: lipopolysaccharide 3-alpha-galactosyltransferase [unclassified Pseudocitrobacter]|uniref:lipopolysaccharide 3-alpha-galactosyltransferase n=1 Tax=unclassified Pseudocitrobacter TaxID=2638778 RepID=UPI0023E39D7E|nr:MULTISPECIES: lipopolysaccharide 3-alpha-galactosyltransferase [unclassified Pseudocitrobacter]MDF3826810.1 lipopolysaccharide 3-alpha-galactosyltransferase [Pseudocitrobacter sp. 2023EL-00150]MEC5372547.1 lipopolysaccharide 3-alpha-galactosyltransferase [Pseudocitrobacter sp. MW920760]